MDEISQWQPQDRSDLFRVAGDSLGLTPGLIEKDFWVCWVLRRLYTNIEVSAQLHFKGGTSLSKVFGVIERMSEDVDLVIDRTDLGFTDTRDPMNPELSGKARQRIVDEIRSKAREFVRSELQHALRHACAEALGVAASPRTWELEIADDDADDQTILFRYPTIEQPSRYMRAVVRLELGARGDPWPSVSGPIRPYAADTLPAPFVAPDTELPRVVSAERTFWDKVTVLHRIHHQPEDKPLAPRMARHYYDVFRFAEHELGQKAILDVDLLAKVVEHTSLFFPRAWAKYELAKPGSLRLTPPAHFLDQLRGDYEEMASEMMFGGVPDFEAVIGRIAEIEFSVNM